MGKETNHGRRNQEHESVDKDIFGTSDDDVRLKGTLGLVKNKEIIASKGLQCKKCGAFGFRDQFNLNRHDLKMHHVTDVFCNKCEVVFVDRLAFMAHNKNCYYVCSYPNCNFLTKRDTRLKIHERSHKKN